MRITFKPIQRRKQTIKLGRIERELGKITAVGDENVEEAWENAKNEIEKSDSYFLGDDENSLDLDPEKAKRFSSDKTDCKKKDKTDTKKKDRTEKNSMKNKAEENSKNDDKIPKYINNILTEEESADTSPEVEKESKKSKSIKEDPVDVFNLESNNSVFDNDENYNSQVKIPADSEEPLPDDSIFNFSNSFGGNENGIEPSFNIENLVDGPEKISDSRNFDADGQEKKIKPKSKVGGMARGQAKAKKAGSRVSVGRAEMEEVNTLIPVGIGEQIETAVISLTEGSRILNEKVPESFSLFVIKGCVSVDLEGSVGVVKRMESVIVPKMVKYEIMALKNSDVFISYNVGG